MVFIPDALDPTSDRRFMALSSPALRIGPSPSSRPAMGRAPQAAMRFRSSMEGDQREIPYIMDRYLSFMGVGLDLRGDERVPRRETVSEFLRSAMTLDYDLLPWAKASIRLGNLVSVGLKRMLDLPIEEDARTTFVDLWSERVRGLYERADAFPQIRWTALSNQAMVEHWTGGSERALSLLDYVMKKNVDEDRMVEARTKKAIILFETGRGAQANEILRQIPARRDARLQPLLDQEEDDEEH